MTVKPHFPWKIVRRSWLPQSASDSTINGSKPPVVGAEVISTGTWLGPLVDIYRFSEVKLFERLPYDAPETAGYHTWYALEVYADHRWIWICDLVPNGDNQLIGTASN